MTEITRPRAGIVIHMTNPSREEVERLEKCSKMSNIKIYAKLGYFKKEAKDGKLSTEF